MEAKQKIILDFVGHGATPLVHVVQGDIGTRALEIDIFAAGVAWEVPTGVDVALRYKKPDGTQGLYTELPDGTKAATVDTTNKNRVTLLLAPQVMTVAGDVIADLAVTDTAQVLASFAIIIRVHPNPAAEPTESTDYYKYGTLEQINQALESLETASGRAVYKVNGVVPDAEGNVNTPGAGTGGEVVSVNGKNGIVVLRLPDLADGDTLAAAGKELKIGGVQVGGDGAEHRLKFATGDTTGKAHNTGIYGGNSADNIAFGVYDWIKSCLVLAYDDQDNMLRLGTGTQKVSINDNLVTEVIVEKQEITLSNKWNYRKYSDGSCDLWAYLKISGLNATTQMGSWYSATAPNLADYPFSLTQWLPTASFVPGDAGLSVIPWAIVDGTATNPPRYWLIGPNSQAGVNGKLVIFVHGRWR